MLKRTAHLAIGIALLVLSGYFLREVALGWKTSWRQEMSRTARPTKSSKPAADDPLYGVADVKVYGVLSPKDEAENEDAALPPPSESSASPVEQVTRTTLAPNHFLHKRILVQTYKGIEFVVPQLALHPQLHGTFRSVPTDQSWGSPVEVLLMRDGDYATFVHNETETTESSASPSNHGTIDWPLSATYAKPQKYYLVFRNSADEQGKLTLDVDFTVNFD